MFFTVLSSVFFDTANANATNSITPNSRMAEPSPEEKAIARDSMEQGDAAFDARHYDEALALYEQADKLVGVTTTGLAVALALEKLGRLCDARDQAWRVSQRKAASNEPRVLTEARARAATLTQELDRTIPQLHLVARGQPPSTPIHVRIDNSSRLSNTTQPIQLDPGPHTYQITVQGYDTINGKVMLQRNERRRVEYVLTPSNGANLTASSKHDEPVPQPSQSGEPALVMAYVGFGLGAAGLIAGATTGILSLKKASDAKKYCEGTSCYPQAKPDADESKKLATASNISFGVGLAGVGLGIAALLWLKSSDTDTTSSYPPIQTQITTTGAAITYNRGF